MPTRSPAVAVSEATRKRREAWLKGNRQLDKDHDALVPAVVSEEEFWQQRKEQLELGDAEAGAEEDVASERLDPGFSLKDDCLDGNGNYVFSDTNVSKLFKLYPWLQAAYDKQVTHGSRSLKDFFEEVSGSILMGKLSRIEETSFATYKNTHDKTENAKVEKARHAKVADLASEVPGEYNLMVTVSDKSLLHNDGYGVPGLMDGFLSSRGQVAEQKSVRSTINRRSQMALRSLLDNALDRKMRMYWAEQKDERTGILTGVWNPLEAIGAKQIKRASLSLFALAKLVKNFEPPPRECNGLGLDGPPQRAVEYTCRLYDALTALEKKKKLGGGGGGSAAGASSQKTTLQEQARDFFLECFKGQFLGKKRRRQQGVGMDAVGYGGGDLLRQHPDLQRSAAFETDHTRFETFEDVGDRLLHRRQKRHKTVAGGGDDDGDSSAVLAATPSESHRDVDREVFERFARIERSAPSSYSEPEPVVALEVFRASMQRIQNHVNPFATLNASGKTRHELERLPSMKDKVVSLKKGLTELMRLFFKATANRNLPKVVSLWQRIDTFDEDLTAWRQGLPHNTARVVETFLITMKEQIGAVRERYNKMKKKQDQKMRAKQ